MCLCFSSVFLSINFYCKQKRIVAVMFDTIDVGKRWVFFSSPKRRFGQRHQTEMPNNNILTSSSSSTWPTGVGVPEGANASIRFQFHFFRCIFLVDSKMLAATRQVGEDSAKSSRLATWTMRTISKLWDERQAHASRITNTSCVPFAISSFMCCACVFRYVYSIRTRVRCLCLNYYYFYVVWEMNAITPFCHFLSFASSTRS